jgi:SWI/SNF-related matrix-associated actin-dependent regulator of chromatin subfamily A-like protein 1
MGLPSRRADAGCRGRLRVRIHANNAVKPRPYQLVGRDFLLSHSRALLADEMRVGKTPQAILAAEDMPRVLVIAPAVATEQWQQEWVRWAGRASGIIGTNAIVSNTAIVSYDMAVRKQEQLKCWRWDVLICDEAHYLKNPGAQRTGVVLGKGGIAYSADRLWMLTGTPMPKDPSERWVMARCFGLTQMSYGEWLARYCRLDPINQRVKGALPAAEEIKPLFAPVTLRRTRAEVAPEMGDVEATPLYLKPANRTVMFDLPKGATDEELLSWLASQGPNAASTRTEVAMAKVEPLAEIILEAFAEGELTRTVVFGYHIPPMREMERRLVEGGLRVKVIRGDVPVSERTRICDAFRRGDVDVVIVQIIAGGVAIDLSTARHGYALEIDWVPGNNWQAWNRMVSMDKPDAVTVDIVTLPGTSDEAINRVVARRAMEVRNHV